MTTKTLSKLPGASKALTPASAVQTAYDLKMTPEAIARLAEISEAADYANEQTAIASKISVRDEASNAAAADVVVNLAKTSRVMEDLRKYYTDPLEKAKKQIIALFKKLGADAAGQEDRLRQELGAFYMEQENKRRKIESDRLAKEQADQRKARALGRSAPAPVAAAPAPEVARQTQSENGSVGIKLKWGFDVVDAALVPRKYLKIDESAIRAAIADNVREIPGVLISERPETAVR